MNGYFNYKDELYHHGILGMKWGVRRYQNKDGTLTAQGKKHVENYKESKRRNERVYQEADKLIKSNKKLQKEFGNSSKNIDDMDLFDLTLQENKISGKDFYKAKADDYKFRKQNAESINLGRKLDEIYKDPNKRKKYSNNGRAHARKVDMSGALAGIIAGTAVTAGVYALTKYLPD